MLCVILVFKIWHGIGVFHISFDIILIPSLVICCSTHSAGLTVDVANLPKTVWMCMLILNFKCILKRRALPSLRKRSLYQSTINLTSVTDKNSLNSWHLYHLIVPSPICVWDICNLFIHLQLHFQPLATHIPPLSSSFCFLLPVSELFPPLSSHDVWLSKIYLLFFLILPGHQTPTTFYAKNRRKMQKGHLESITEK